MAPVDLLQPQIASSTAAKLAALRSLMSLHQLDGYFIPSADEHLNEYVPDAKQRRVWLSGFTGSAGDFLVVRQDELAESTQNQPIAWVFVDSRYYEQADLQVDSALIQISKQGLEGHKTLEEVLENLGRASTQAGTTFRLGYDPFTIAVGQFHKLQERLEPCGVKLVPSVENLVDQVRSQSPWTEAESLPAYADSPVFLLPDALTGEAIEQKLERVRAAMQQMNTDILPITKLDQVAWLHNLRGWDVPYNPVFIAYAIVTANQAFLFTNLGRIEPEVQQRLQSCVILLPYDHYATTLRSLVEQMSPSRVLIDSRHTTMGTYQILADYVAAATCQSVETNTPIEGMKARKNPVEIAQMQQANLKASRAKTRALKWITDQLASGEPITELDVAQTVEGFYAEEPGFQGLSFNTIAGTGANSSIVHYGTPDAQIVLQSGAFLLLDSGAQYTSGTTDDTRTIIVGEPTSQQVERYTEVLKAHINCAMQRFPKGTTGAQLDGITRSTLWDAGLDYGHGTGHGVGAFLNVHEGPNGISKRVQEPLEPGMVTSIEPGYYEPGWGGIRIENLYVVKPFTNPSSLDGEQPKPAWYEFESLTYIPFDKRLIDVDRLNSRQRAWLESYHQMIIDQLSPTLTALEAAWLQEVCCF